MVIAREDLLSDDFFTRDLPANAPTLTRALHDLKNRAARYRTFDEYYRGKHYLAFATDKFRNAFGHLFRTFADNLCPAVCDAVTDNLQVVDFAVEEGPAKLAKEAKKLWERNRMDQRAGEVHKEATKSGDAYVIVWPDSDGHPVIYPQKAGVCTVAYDTEQPGLILWAAKFWLTPEKKIRGNLYYPDRIEKFITRNTSPNGLPEGKSAFVEFKVKDEKWPLPNDYGVVPVFHFGNNGGVGEMGVSELVPAIPLQDALNKAVLDMMVAMEFAAFRQRWATGIEVTLDNAGNPIPPFIPGVERLWTVDSSEAKFGQFDTTDLDQFLKVGNDFRLEMARVTATPLHYLNLQSSSVPSGEALKTLEKRHVKKVQDRMTSFGNVWENVMALALRINGSKKARLSTNWADPFGPTDKEKLDTLVTKKTLGVSEEQLLQEAGYGESDIARMQQQNAKRREEARRDFDAL